MRDNAYLNFDGLAEEAMTFKTATWAATLAA
jgi:hypothetical protein